MDLEDKGIEVINSPEEPMIDDEDCINVTPNLEQHSNEQTTGAELKIPSTSQQIEVETRKQYTAISVVQVSSVSETQDGSFLAKKSRSQSTFRTYKQHKTVSRGRSLSTTVANPSHTHDVPVTDDARQIFQNNPTNFGHNLQSFESFPSGVITPTLYQSFRHQLPAVMNEYYQSFSQPDSTVNSAQSVEPSSRCFNNYQQSQPDMSTTFKIPSRKRCNTRSLKVSCTRTVTSSHMSNLPLHPTAEVMNYQPPSHNYAPPQPRSPYEYSTPFANSDVRYQYQVPPSQFRAPAPIINASSISEFPPNFQADSTLRMRYAASSTSQTVSGPNRSIREHHQQFVDYSQSLTYSNVQRQPELMQNHPPLPHMIPTPYNSIEYNNHQVCPNLPPPRYVGSLREPRAPLPARKLLPPSRLPLPLNPLPLLPPSSIPLSLQFSQPQPRPSEAVSQRSIAAHSGPSQSALLPYALPQCGPSYPAQHQPGPSHFGSHQLALPQFPSSEPGPSQPTTAQFALPQSASPQPRPIQSTLVQCVSPQPGPSQPAPPQSTSPEPVTVSAQPCPSPAQPILEYSLEVPSPEMIQRVPPEYLQQVLNCIKILKQKELLNDLPKSKKTVSFSTLRLLCSHYGTVFPPSPCYSCCIDIYKIACPKCRFCIEFVRAIILEMNRSAKIVLGKLKWKNTLEILNGDLLNHITRLLSHRMILFPNNYIKHNTSKQRWLPQIQSHLSRFLISQDRTPHNLVDHLNFIKEVLSAQIGLLTLFERVNMNIFGNIAPTRSKLGSRYENYSAVQREAQNNVNLLFPTQELSIDNLIEPQATCSGLSSKSKKSNKGVEPEEEEGNAEKEITKKGEKYEDEMENSD